MVTDEQVARLEAALQADIRAGKMRAVDPGVGPAEYTPAVFGYCRDCGHAKAATLEGIPRLGCARLVRGCHRPAAARPVEDDVIDGHVVRWIVSGDFGCVMFEPREEGSDAR